MAGREGIDTFAKVVAFQPSGCDRSGEGRCNLLIQKCNFYCGTGVFLRHLYLSVFEETAARGQGRHDLLIIREAVEQATIRLLAAGVEGPRQEAWLLLAHMRQQDRVTLLAHARDCLKQDEWFSLQELVRRRAAREPLAQIVGRKEFWSLDFAITSDVLCPRPDSETLIEAALAELGGRCDMGDWAGRVLDLGTGSGCLLLTLLSELTAACGVGIDISKQALSVAGANGRSLGLADRVAWVRGDWAATLRGHFDLIISNPPYIATSEAEALAPEVRQFEPEGALFGGDDGLEAYRALSLDLERLLAPDGLICLEVGLGQAEAVEGLLKANGLKSIDRHQDLAGIDRCLIARR